VAVEDVEAVAVEAAAGGGSGSGGQQHEVAGLVAPVLEARRFSAESKATSDHQLIGSYTVARERRGVAVDRRRPVAERGSVRRDEAATACRRYQSGCQTSRRLRCFEDAADNVSGCLPASLAGFNVNSTRSPRSTMTPFGAR
jgi:hypothetical protein